VGWLSTACAGPTRLLADQDPRYVSERYDPRTLIVALTHNGTIDNSNIRVFTYRRSVVLAQLQFVY